MKKILLSAVAAVSAASVFAASPAATQQWVKNYITSNVTQIVEEQTSAFAPVSWQSVDEDGSVVTLTMTFSVATNDALEVFDSNVLGMTNGTVFAKVGEYAYRNYLNTDCDYFAGRLEKLFVSYGDGVTTVETNATPYVTNTVYATTNDVYGVRYGFSVGEYLVSGVDSTVGTSDFSVTNAPAGTNLAFRLRAVKITDAEKKAITTPPSVAGTFSVLDLLFPSCYAITYGPWEKVGESKQYIGGRTVITRHSERHLYTDSGDACNINLGEVTVSKEGAETPVVYNLSGVEILKIAGGEHIEDLKSRSPKSQEDMEAEIKNIVGPVRWKIHFQNSDAFKKAINDAIDYCSVIIEDLASRTCPEESDKEEDSDHECDKDPAATLSGVCGNWYCNVKGCGRFWSSMVSKGYMGSHSWDTERYPNCKRCKNKHCDYISPSESDHGGWHNVSGAVLSGDSYSCVCNCGHFSLPHSHGEILGYVDGATVSDLSLVNSCLRKEKCGRCKTFVDALSDPWGGTIYPVTHSLTQSAKYKAVEDEEGNSKCQAFEVCDQGRNAQGVSLGCGKQNTETFDHLKNEEYYDCEEIVGNDENHKLFNPCGNGFDTNIGSDGKVAKKSAWAKISSNTNWCGYCFTNEVAHNYNPDDFFLDLGANHGIIEWCINDDVEIDNTHCGHQHQKSTDEHHYEVTNCVFATSKVHKNYLACRECLHPSTEYKPHYYSTANLNYTYRDILHHTVSNYCPECETSYEYGITNHTKSADAADWTRTFLDDTNHIVSNRCYDCRGWYFYDFEKHVSFEAYRSKYASVTKDTHVVSNFCSDAIGCGRWYAAYIEDCDFSGRVELIDIADTNDIIHCGHEADGCSNTAATVSHNWIADGDYYHRCINGKGHLHDPHTFVDDICKYCGWNRLTHVQENNRRHVLIETNSCHNCILEPRVFGCYQVVSNVTVGASIRESHVIETQCAAGWNSQFNKCGCSACLMDLGFGCSCGWGSIFKGPTPEGPICGSTSVNEN